MNIQSEENVIIDEKALASMKRLKEWAAVESLQPSGVVAGDDDCDCDCQDCD